MNCAILKEYFFGEFVQYSLLLIKENEDKREVGAFI